MMSQALRNIDYCDIFSTYKKSWAAEDKMKNESPFQEKDVNIKPKKEALPGGGILRETAQSV